MVSWQTRTSILLCLQHTSTASELTVVNGLLPCADKLSGSEHRNGTLIYRRAYRRDPPPFRFVPLRVVGAQAAALSEHVS